MPISVRNWLLRKLLNLPKDKILLATLLLDRKHRLLLNKHQAIEAIRQFYLFYLVEDPIDGSGFDSVVLETLKDLESAHIVSTQSNWQVETIRGRVVNSFAKTEYGFRQASNLVEEIRGTNA